MKQSFLMFYVSIFILLKVIDIFFFIQVFALENPNVNVLSYSPGPVETDMFHTVCENLIDSDAKKQFNELRTTKTVLTPEQTVNRLLDILREQKYKSADHVDYYDEL